MDIWLWTFVFLIPPLLAVLLIISAWPALTFRGRVIVLAACSVVVAVWWMIW